MVVIENLVLITPVENFKNSSVTKSALSPEVMVLTFSHWEPNRAWEEGTSYCEVWVISAFVNQGGTRRPGSPCICGQLLLTEKTGHYTSHSLFPKVALRHWKSSSDSSSQFTPVRSQSSSQRIPKNGKTPLKRLLMTSYVQGSEDQMVLSWQCSPDWSIDSIVIKFPPHFFAGIDMLICKFRGPRIVKTILKKKTKVRELTLLNFKIFYQAGTVKTVWYWTKERPIYIDGVEVRV